MASDDITGELREFVYIDDQSINGHLSSMGVGLETGIQESEDDSTEKSGRFFGRINIPGLPVGGGTEGELSRQSSEGIEKQIDITVPYRYQTLRELITKAGVEIKDGSSGLSHGDVVEINGTVKPMSLFQLELAEQTITGMSEVLEVMFDTLESIQEQEHDPNVEQALEKARDSTTGHAEVNQATIDASKILNDNRVPIRIDNENGSYGALLDRDAMKLPEPLAFSQPRSYTVFGRVEQRVKAGEKWEPIDRLRLYDSYSATSDNFLETFREAIQNIAQGHDLALDDEDIVIEGSAKIIHPIAIYW